MAWYKTGSVSVANGSAAVTGAGTLWMANARRGDVFQGPDHDVYEISNVDADGRITLASTYRGATAAGGAYAIAPTHSYIRELTTQVAALIASLGGGGTGGTGGTGGGTGTVTSVAVTQPAEGLTITGGPVTTDGTLVFALADDLAAVEALETTGLVRRTAANTWTAGGDVHLSNDVTGVLQISNGGTGGGTAAEARAGLGLGSAAQLDVDTDVTMAADSDARLATQKAVRAHIAAAVADLVGSSPATLNTLAEIASALGNDPDFAATLTTALAAKAPINSPALTGVPTAPTAPAGTATTQIATTEFVASMAGGRADFLINQVFG